MQVTLSDTVKQFRHALDQLISATFSLTTYALVVLRKLSMYVVLFLMEKIMLG